MTCFLPFDDSFAVLLYFIYLNLLKMSTNKQIGGPYQQQLEKRGPISNPPTHKSPSYTSRSPYHTIYHLPPFNINQPAYNDNHIMIPKYQQ